MNLLLILAFLIIAILAGYAWSLHQKVKEQKQQQLKAQAEAEQSLRTFQLGLVKDIGFIARSVLSEQCEISEGALRLHYLLNSLDPEVWQQAELETLRSFYVLIAQMPILDAYKALSKQEQFKLDNQRWALETEHKERIFKELEWLANHRFPSITLLH